MRKICLLLLIFSFFLGCSSEKKEVIKVGFDPEWTNLPLSTQEKSNLNGFVEDLLLNISSLANVNMEKVEELYYNLNYGLDSKKLDIVFSFEKPYNFNEAKYSFSPIIFHPGMVLVVAKSSPYTKLQDLSGHILFYPEKNGAILLLQKYPDIIVKRYEVVADAIGDVVNGISDGVLVDHLVALSFMKNLYVDDLKIIGPLEEDEGLRLLTSKENSNLNDLISQILHKMDKTELLLQLKRKWHLE